MIIFKSQLKEIIEYERELYLGSKGIYQFVLKVLKAHPDYYVWKYIKRLRTTSYYYSKRKDNLFYSLMYFWNCRKKNRIGRQLGIEINENSFGKGLMIYHTQGIVINGGTVVGENCKLHGNNCIGNDGKSLECPVIGNNVRLGVGAKVIGNVKIADNITIAAGAVVISSFEEEGITIAGVPAKKKK